VYLAMATYAHDRCAPVHVDKRSSSKAQARHALGHGSAYLFIAASRAEVQSQELTP